AVGRRGQRRPACAGRFGSGNAELKTMVEGYQMTAQGLRRLGSGQLDTGGNKTPGVLVPLAVAAATANPIGLRVGGTMKLYGEKTGSDTIEGAGKRTADAIAKPTSRPLPLPICAPATPPATPPRIKPMVSLDSTPGVITGGQTLGW